MKLPEHISLTIEHNPHAAKYETAAQWPDDYEMVVPAQDATP